MPIYTPKKKVSKCYVSSPKPQQTISVLKSDSDFKKSQPNFKNWTEKNLEELNIELNEEDNLEIWYNSDTQFSKEEIDNCLLDIQKIVDCFIANNEQSKRIIINSLVTMIVKRYSNEHPLTTFARVELPLQSDNDKFGHGVIDYAIGEVKKIVYEKPELQNIVLLIEAKQKLAKRQKFQIVAELICSLQYNLQNHNDDVDVYGVLFDAEKVSSN